MFEQFIRLQGRCPKYDSSGEYFGDIKIREVISRQQWLANLSPHLRLVQNDHLGPRFLTPM